MTVENREEVDIRMEVRVRQMRCRTWQWYDNSKQAELSRRSETSRRNRF